VLTNCAASMGDSDTSNTTLILHFTNITKEIKTLEEKTQSQKTSIIKEEEANISDNSSIFIRSITLQVMEIIDILHFLKQDLRELDYSLSDDDAQRLVGVGFIINYIKQQFAMGNSQTGPFVLPRDRIINIKHDLPKLTRLQSALIDLIDHLTQTRLEEVLHSLSSLSSQELTFVGIEVSNCRNALSHFQGKKRKNNNQSN